jgi:hypothetical protein
VSNLRGNAVKLVLSGLAILALLSACTVAGPFALTVTVDPADATITLAGPADPSVDYQVDVGVFRYLLTAGSYTVSVEAVGYASEAQQVDLGADTAISFDLESTSDWTGVDVGAVGVPGGFDPVTLTVEGAGAGIEGDLDAFHFVYQNVAGDVEITARVADLTGGSAARAGVMLRDGLDPDARYAAVLVTGDGEVRFQGRTTTGGTTQAGSGGSGPTWLKLVRVGDTFTGYSSDDGQDWIRIASLDIALPNALLAGHAVTSGDTAASAEADFDDSDIGDPTLFPPPPPTGGEGTFSGPQKVWQPLTISWEGPTADELDDTPNPFLDLRLDVTFTGPSAQSYTVPGYFDGDGVGGSSGDVWRVRFTPDEAGTWSYLVSFRSGDAIAVSTDAGASTSFDGDSGEFLIDARDPGAPGFLRWGRLEYVGDHYLKLRDGPYWIKTGIDSPEDFLGYGDFDATPSDHLYSAHVADWQAGDPTWDGGKGKGIIGALNYLGDLGMNSIYFLPMNIGGDGQNTWPYAGSIDPAGSAANDNLHFDLSKLLQWEIVFAHAQARGVALHVVLAEGEKDNKEELDDATLGVERKLFHRELVARFGHHNALFWNIAEEYNYNPGGEPQALPLSAGTVMAFADHLRSVDPYDHPITVHNWDNTNAWDPFFGEAPFDATSMQINPADLAAESKIEAWRSKSTSEGRPIMISLDEFRRTDIDNLDDQRRDFLWPILLSGGHLEYIIQGTRSIDDFGPYEELWRWSGIARAFLESNLPYWEMQPADALLSGETGDDGEVFAKSGEVYAVYLPDASASGSLNLSATSGDFTLRWFNPRTGAFDGGATTISGGAPVALGSPPNSSGEDWVALIER